MKRKLINFSLIAAMIFGLCGLSACDDDSDLIVDYSPIVLQVWVKDAQGNNLLDPDNPDNILDEEMWIDYKNEVSVVGMGQPDPSGLTRAYLPQWYGAYIAPAEYLYWDQEYFSIDNRIFIGEFDGGNNGEFNVVLTIGDKSYNLSWTNKVNKLNTKRQFYIDGKKNKDSVFNITLP